ncbi:MAG TPA: DUF3106 domain-containing protein [Bryobacteraceae bacterium]|nr:DUF3106 domain-containing protein [Bryobacteraceae bacterium]
MMAVPALSGWPIAPMRAGPPKGQTVRNPRSPRQSRNASPKKRPRAVHAGSARPASPTIAELDRMSPIELAKFLNQLSPAQRKQAEQDLRSYEGLSPDQKERVQRQYEAFQALPAAKQAEIRQAYESYRRSPPARQLAIQREIRTLKELPPQEQKRRLASSEFSDHFSPDERKTIHGLLEAPTDQ